MPTETRQIVVLDVMGADSGPEEIIRGGLLAATSIPDSLDLVFIGREEAINAVLDTVDDKPGNITVQHAPTEVPMYTTATNGVRKRDSSIAIGLKLLRRKKAAAFVSPGNTGAVMASSLLTLGRIKGVVRPAIVGVFPTSTGKPCVVLDVGANADCKPQHLSQFAVMGSVFSEVAFGVQKPRVGLLSIGEERSKGNELIFSAQELLKTSNINFVGNVEGRDILSGAIDVAVTDGFTGNILLKFAESITPMMVKAVRHQIQTNIFSRMGTMLLLPFLRRMRAAFDYAENGGAPLLGTNGVVIICHGASNARAIHNAVKLAHSMARTHINERIHNELVTKHFGKDNESNHKGQDYRDRVVRSTSGDDQR